MGTLTVNQNKLQKRLRRLAGEAVADFNMIEDGDKVMVCLSGGKDSYTMLDVLLHLQKVAPIKFEIVAVNMDQKQPGFPEHVLPAYLKELGVEYHIVEKDTYSVVKELIPEGKTTCSLCSRLRRGTLYTFADEIGATKMALGHHRDDIVETFFLNMFFNGSLKGGDPFIFGRGGEEIEELAAHGIPFQVVPGITAASGCAAYAGIPLTHRDYAQSVRFITGHLKDGTSDLPWHDLVGPSQTLVFYMGLVGLPIICEQLIKHGRAADTPAALIQQGTTSNQRVFTGTLADLPRMVAEHEVHAPTLVIVGEVVVLREKLKWFEGAQSQI